MTSGAIDFACYSVGPMPCRIGTRLLYLIFLLSFFKPIDSVCIHCKDSIVGCKGGDQCPTIADVNANGVLFEEASLGKVPKASGLLPPQLLQYFTRPVMEAIVAIACAQRFRPPASFIGAALQSTVERAWQVHRQLSRLL